MATPFNSSAPLLGSLVAMCMAGVTCGGNYSGPGGAIPRSDGALVAEIFVADHFVVADVSATLLGLCHTWCADFSATLAHTPSGTSISLVSRIGKTAAATSFGDSSDFLGDYTFADSGGAIWAAAAALPASAALASGIYGATGPFSSAPLNMTSTFAGIDGFGTWTLTVMDLAKGDPGSLDGWSLALGGGPPSADLNGDGVVDGADVGLLLNAWGTSGPGILGDLNDDGTVDAADLGILLAAWG